MGIRTLVACTLCAAGAATAQDVPAIDTDRPDQTESSALVAPRHLQIEGGFVYSDDGGGVLEWPSALLRLGVIERLELRFGIPTFETSFSGADTTDFADPDFGVKLKLWEEKGARPEAALIASTTIPIGSSRVSSDRFDPAFRFAFGHTLPAGFSLGYNAGIAWATASAAGVGRSTDSRFEYTAALGYDFTDRWGAFIEIFGDVGLSDSGGAAHSLDGGLTYLLRENLQLDAALGVGLTDEAPDWFLTAGASYRFAW